MKYLTLFLCLILVKLVGSWLVVPVPVNEKKIEAEKNKIKCKKIKYPTMFLCLILVKLVGSWLVDPEPVNEKKNFVAEKINVKKSNIQHCFYAFFCIIVYFIIQEYFRRPCPRLPWNKRIPSEK